MIELSVAVLIGLFLLGALATVVQNNKRAFVGQNQLAQLQDGERLALGMMTDVIQTAGYFPNPALNSPTQASIFPATGSLAQGQTIFGTYGGGTAPGDSITVRFTTASGDGVLNCNGSSNTTGANALYINTFSVLNGQLICTPTINGVAQAAIPLVGTGTAVNNQSLVVTNLTILYGVNSTGGTTTNVDTYMNATQVNAANLWNSVISVWVMITFNYPTFAADRPTTQSVTVQRMVGVMSRSGVQS